MRRLVAAGSARGSEGSAATRLRAPAATVEPVSPSPARASRRLSSDSSAIRRSQAARIAAASAGFALAGGRGPFGCRRAAEGW